MGVSGWMFLLVPAHPGCPRQIQKAIKWLCVCVCDRERELDWISILLLLLPSFNDLFQTNLSYLVCLASSFSICCRKEPLGISRVGFCCLDVLLVTLPADHWCQNTGWKTKYSTYYQWLGLILSSSTIRSWQKRCCFLCAGSLVPVPLDNGYPLFRVIIATGNEFNIKAKCIVNATGPYTDFVRELDNENSHKICQPSSGTHIVLPDYYRSAFMLSPPHIFCRLFMAVFTWKSYCWMESVVVMVVICQCYIFTVCQCCSPSNMGLLDPSTSDGRVIFFLPWKKSTMAGWYEHILI